MFSTGQGQLDLFFISILTTIHLLKTMFAYIYIWLPFRNLFLDKIIYLYKNLLNLSLLTILLSIALNKLPWFGPYVKITFQRKVSESQEVFTLSLGGQIQSRRKYLL